MDEEFEYEVAKMRRVTCQTPGCIDYGNVHELMSVTVAICGACEGYSLVEEIA